MGVGPRLVYSNIDEEMQTQGPPSPTENDEQSRTVFHPRVICDQLDYHPPYLYVYLPVYLSI